MIYREHPVTATGILGAEGAAAQAMRRPGCCPEVPKIPGQSFLVLHLHEVLAAFLSHHLFPNACSPAPDLPHSAPGLSFTASHPPGPGHPTMSLLHKRKSNSCLQKPLTHSRARHSGASGTLSPVNKQEASPTGFQGAKNRFHLASGQAAATKVLNPFPSNLPPSPWQLERGLIRSL